MTEIRMCSFDGCINRHLAKGLCNGHYTQKHHGKELTPLNTHPRKYPPGMAYCSICKTLKTIEDFSKNKGRKHGVHYWCKRCTRKDSMRRKYGIDFEVLFDSQGRMCAGCRRSDQTRWHVDHDHSCCPGGQNAKTCGECVRGILCNGCNLGLGQLEDNPQTLRRLADYVERTAHRKTA